MPEPVLTAIAAALARQATGSLYEVVKGWFAGKPAADAALTAAAGTAPDSAEVQALSQELQRATDADTEFAAQLQTAWQQMTVDQDADQGGVANFIGGDVSGNVVQARDIDGGINLGGSH